MFSKFKINKLIIFYLGSIALLVSIFYGLLMLPDYEKLYQNFYKSAKIDFQPQNLGHLQIVKFPLPVLKVDNINEPGKIELENLAIHFSFWSIVTLKPEIKIVKIKNAKIYLAEADFNLIDHHKIIAELIQKKGFNIDVDIAELMVIDSNNKRKIIFKNLFLDAEGQDRIFTGEIQNIGKFAGSFKNNANITDFKFDLNNSTYNLDIAETYQDSVFTTGKAELEVHDILGLLNSDLPELDFLWNKNSLLEPIKISSNIVIADNSMKFSDIKFSANWLSGTGDLSLANSLSKPMKLNINLDHIDLSQFKNNEKDTAKFENKQYFILPDGGLDAEISIKQIFLKNGEKINNVEFISNAKEDITIVKNFTGQIASGGNFTLNGEITHNDFRSLFNGQLNFQHKDISSFFKIVNSKQNLANDPIPLSLTTDLKCSLIDLYFNNIVVKTVENQITGAVSAKFIGSLPRFNGSLDFSALDLNQVNYPIISPIYEYIKLLSQNMKDKDYLNKFIPIRTLSYLGNFDLNFKNLTIDQYKLDNINLLLSIKDDQIAINNLYLNKGDDYLNLDLNLNVANIKPKLNIKVKDASLPFDYLSPQALLDLRNNILNNYSLDKVNLSWDCNFSKLYQKNSSIEKVKFTGENDNILLLISQLNADFLGGNFNSQGSILLDPYTINFAYALNSLDLAKLSNALPKGILDTEGAASFNGVFSTNGDSMQKQLYNLYSKSNILAKDIKLKNISVDDLISSVGFASYNTQNFASDLKNALLTGETKINSLKGDLELNNGVTAIKDLNFQTNYALGNAAGSFNIYDFGIDLSSTLTFYLLEKNYNNRLTTKMNVKFSGSIFGPKKVADTAELIKAMQTRKNMQN